MSDLDYGLAGKVALVTGAGRKRGFGRAIALRLARHGADVVVADLCRAPHAGPDSDAAAREELEGVAAEVEALGRRSLPVEVDVARAAEVEAMVSKALGRFERIDVLVNNAGAFLPFKPLAETTEEEWDLAFDVNCKGAFLCCKYVVPAMIRRGEGGKILNMSSKVGKTGQALEAPYSASKAALINFTQSLALELAPHGINVNALCPSIALTDTGTKSLEEYVRLTGESLTLEEARKRVLAKVPLGRFVTVEEVADLTAFLVSRHADYMTGQAVNLTGGQVMH